MKDVVSECTSVFVQYDIIFMSTSSALCPMDVEPVSDVSINGRHFSIDSVGCNGFVASPNVVSREWRVDGLENVVSGHHIGCMLGGVLEGSTNLINRNMQEVWTALSIVYRFLLDFTW